MVTWAPQPQCPGVSSWLETQASSGCCSLSMASARCPIQPQSGSALSALGLGAGPGSSGRHTLDFRGPSPWPPPPAPAQAEAPGSFWPQQSPEACGAEPAPPQPRLPPRGRGRRGHTSGLSLPQLLQLGSATSFFRQSWSSSLSHSVSPAIKGGRKTIESHPSLLLSTLLGGEREGTSWLRRPSHLELETCALPAAQTVAGRGQWLPYRKSP